MKKTVAFLASFALLGVALSGCTADDPTRQRSPAPSTASVQPIPTATSTPSDTPSPSIKPTPTPSVTRAYQAPVSQPAPAPVSSPTKAKPTATKKPVAQVDPNAPKDQCTDKQMLTSVQQDPDGGGLGQRRAFVVIENDGPTCSLRGYPGVSLVGGGNGKQIGQPAIKNGDPSNKTITLKKYDYAVALITYTYIDKDEKKFSDGTVCNAKHADGYRVYPPHSFNSIFTAFDTYACSGDVDWITVGAVEKNHYDFNPALGV